MPPTKRLQIVVYPDKNEYNEIKRKADSLGLTLSKYLIFVGLHADIQVKVKEEK